MIFPSVKPPYWAPEGHSQTLVAHLTGPEILFRDENKKLIPCLDDEDRLLIKYHLRDPKKWILLAHGLAGDSESKYIKRMTQIALERNISVLRFNHRNCGESLGHAKKTYHAGRGEDIYAAANWIRTHYSGSEIIVVGFSLSGNTVLDMLIRFEDKIEIKKTIAVNAPIDLTETSLQIARKENTVYNQYFARLLRNFNSNLATVITEGLGQAIRETKVPAFATLGDYDQLFVAPLSGFKDAWDYYKQCSTIDRLGAIRSSVTLLSAKDDPIIPYQIYLKKKLNPNFHLRLETTGGHLGYLSKTKTPLNSNRWMDWYLIEHIEETFRK
ncbi:MAG: alpha/beta fold hydrolase [Bdellovibrionaceae bacterium]|nr:alpha/beta fold hydrolase [Pseudobdellovibrionaceae bacterium]